MGLGDLSHGHHHLMNEMLPVADPLQIAGFVAIFSYSFLVSLHCAGMCGPLACSILARQQKIRLQSVLLYNMGRMISYVMAGVAVGFISAEITSISLNWGKTFARTAGVLLILAAIVPSQLKHLPFPSMPIAWLSHLQRKILRLPLPLQAIGLGLVTVLLPCMTLHPLLLASAGSGSMFNGGLTMLAFFFGTLPVMVIATYMPTLIVVRLPTQLLALFGRILLIFAGLVTLWRTL